MSKPEITDEQVMDLMREGWGLKKIKRHYNIGTHRITRLRDQLRRRGMDHEHELAREVPDGWKLKGISDMRTNPEGKPIWYKFDEDKQRQAEMQRAALEAMAEDISRLDPISSPGHTDEALCNLYTITDAHIGEYATTLQGGAEWGLEESERVITGCFAAMIESSPKAKYCVINQLGDFLTFDSLDPVTPTNRHPLNVAGIYAELVKMSIKVLRKIIDLSLAKHDEVHLIIAEGNHDLAGSLWLRHMIEALYENEPRLTVNMSETPYYVYQHGKTMLAFHHGHKAKNSDLPGIFAANFPEMWGTSVYREAHTGHYHKEEVASLNGMTVRRHPTLTATGTYASRLGYVSSRRAMGITYHREYGRVAANEVVPEMLCA